MNTHVDKIQENKKQTASHTVIQKKRNSTPPLPFTDNHPATVAQRQLQEIANNSEQIKQATQLQTMVNTNSTLPIQKKGEEEEELQMKSIHPTTQLAGIDEEELLQGKFETAQRVEDEELLQGKFETAQRAEDEELLQGKFESVQRAEKPNNTGLPDNLKSGIENLSGMSMDHVKVHYNSDKPAQLQAHAYAQGSEIHVAPRQEKHLPHEAWHVVQQAQGRVMPTVQMKGVQVNDDVGLEAEADMMAGRALQMVGEVQNARLDPLAETVAQRKVKMMGNNNPQISQLRIIQDIANGSSQVQKAKSFQVMENDFSSSQATPFQTKQSVQLISREVIQRVPDWMNNLFGMARANPIASLAAVGAGAAAVLAYYYWNRQPNVPPQIQPQVQALPDWTTLQGVADAIDVDVNLLNTQLNTGVGHIDINDIYRGGFDPNQESATGLVPSTLTANLPVVPQAKVDSIFVNLNNLPFTYTGNFESGASSFLSRAGDCMSLAQMFKLATEAAGVQEVTIQHDVNAMLVAQHAIHGRNSDCNLDGEAFWFFHDHHWADYLGARYDLLFMANQTPHADHRTQANQLHNGVNYDLFAGGQALIHASQFSKLDVDVTAGRMGRAFVDEGTAQAYIDLHRNNGDAQ